MSRPRRAFARFAAAVLWLASSASAAVLVNPGPAAVAGSAAAAAPSAASAAAWSVSFRSFLTSSAPRLAAVQAAAAALAEHDPGAAETRAALAPVAQALAAALPAALAPPAPDATRAELEAAQLKLKVLNFPAVRALLPESARDAVGRAAWAYNDVLWDARRRGAAAKARAIAARLAETPRSAPEAPPIAASAGADVTVEVLSGDITSVASDALLATVDEAGTCRGGLHSAIAAAGGDCFAAEAAKALPLKEGRTVLARPSAAAATPFKSVLYLSDRRERPLEDVLHDGLRAADAAGLTSVSLPVLRTGSVFGSIEQSAAEVVAALRRGVERFAAAGAASLRRISFVVRNDSELAAKVQTAFAGAAAPRERSLRDDLRPTELSGRGYDLAPRPAAVSDRRSPIYASLLKPWSLAHLLQIHKPVTVGRVEDRAAFSGPTPSVLNMPIKMPGTGFRVPAELEQFREFLQKIIDHENAVNPEMDGWYAYLTVDQHDVSAGSTHRRPGVHIDGVQGARYAVKLPPEHLYSASDRLGTVFYDQSFDLTRLDPARQHVHAELERQAREENAVRVADYDIAYWDSYSVHRADVAPEPLRRTFVRVEFSRKRYDSLGDTHNPLFEYDWRPVARPIPANLDDRPLAPAPSAGYRPELEALSPDAPHTVKNTDAYLRDNLGDEAADAARRGGAPFLITVGEGREALARARSLGWTIGAKLSKREGYHQVFAAKDPSGKEGFVLQRVNGEDRVLHIQSLLKLAGARAEFVFTEGATKSWRAHYRAAFDKLGYVPDLVVYGFANTAIDSALLRNAFKNGRHFATLKRNYARKRAAIAGAGEDSGDLDGMSMQVLELADGRRIWFLHCMFGDLARDLVGAAVDHGAKNVAFIGSAGSLEATARMGEVVTPAAYRRADGTVESLDRLPVIPGVPRRGTYERIATPNLGTKAWAAAARARGTDLIESELGYILDELKDRPDVRLQAALVIAEATYAPEGRDMTEWDLSDLRKLVPALGRVLDSALPAKNSDYVVKSYRSVPLDGR